MKIDFSKIPERHQTDLCIAAIRGCMEAMKTPEGRAAIEKGKQKYLLMRERMERGEIE